MRTKILRELSILLVGVGAIFLTLYYIPWTKEDKKLISIEKEEELGKKLFESLKENQPSMVPIQDEYLDSIISVLKSRILTANPDFQYKYSIELIENNEINAFTLPGGILIVYTGLIEFTDSPEELSSVILHEMGHAENRHIISRLIKELGLKLLMSQDSFVLGEITQNISSLSYDRKQEVEADLFSQERLEKTNIEPKVLGKFFRKLKDQNGDTPKYMSIMSTHPNLSNRIKSCLEYETDPGFQEEKFDLNWEEVKDYISGLDEEEI